MYCAECDLLFSKLNSTEELKQKVNEFCDDESATCIEFCDEFCDDESPTWPMYYYSLYIDNEVIEVSFFCLNCMNGVTIIIQHFQIEKQNVCEDEKMLESEEKIQEHETEEQLKCPLCFEPLESEEKIREHETEELESEEKIQEQNSSIEFETEEQKQNLSIEIEIEEQEENS